MSKPEDPDVIATGALIDHVPLVAVPAVRLRLKTPVESPLSETCAEELLRTTVAVTDLTPV